MAASNAAYRRAFVAMASEAEFVLFVGTEFRRVANIGGGKRVGVLCARSVAGFTSEAGMAEMLVGVDYVMRILFECLRDFVMAGPALCGSPKALGRLRERGRHAHEEHGGRGEEADFL
jgi:hypothetical protein